MIHVIYVHNQYDNLVSGTKKNLIQSCWTQNGQSYLMAEAKAQKKAAPDLPDLNGVQLHFVDFEDVRSILPISQVPCIFLMTEETMGVFPIDNIDKIIKHVEQASLEKGAQR